MILQFVIKYSKTSVGLYLRNLAHENIQLLFFVNVEVIVVVKKALEIAEEIKLSTLLVNIIKMSVIKNSPF